MIPIAQIIQWRQFAPWPDDMQVEQDLILSRIIVDIFSDPLLAKELAFRGGTALHKLFFKPAARYSEDIDLVRTHAGAISPIVDTLRSRLDPWLGKPKTERKDKGFKILYFFISETSPNTRLRVKIEINTRETFSVFDYFIKPFSVQSDWFTGEAQVTTYQLEELIATKLRALYQRKKGRDLFDLWLAITQNDLNISRIIQAFQHYLFKENNFISRYLFEENLSEKLKTPLFLNDIEPLLSPQSTPSSSQLLKTKHEALDDQENSPTTGWNWLDAAEQVKNTIIAHLPG